MELSYLKGEAEKMYRHMVAWRRHLHQFPELSEKEYNTQSYILNCLEKEGIACEKIAATGVMALLPGSGEGKTVALRADIDALPIQEKTGLPFASSHEGVMHACGHDGHTAIALGCACFLHRHKTHYKGMVKVFFQPAEETIGGAKRMIEAGCMKNPVVDYCLGLHVTPDLPADCVEVKYDTLNASTDSFALTFLGKGGHGAYPERCIDAVVMASYAVVQMQSIVSRNVSPLDGAVVTIGKIQGGQKGNIIADKVTLEGTIRATKKEVRDLLIKKVLDVASHTARSFGGNYVWIKDEGYLPLVNHREIVDVVKETAAELLGAERVLEKKEESMGGEDFSFFIQKTPGAFYRVGCKANEEGYGLHTARFVMDERCLYTGMCVQLVSLFHLLETE